MSARILPASMREPHVALIMWTGVALAGATGARAVLSTYLPFVQDSYSLDAVGVATLGIVVTAGQGLSLLLIRAEARRGLRRAHVVSIGLFVPIAAAAAPELGFAGFGLLQLLLHAVIGAMLALSSAMVMRVAPRHKRAVSEAFMQAAAALGPAAIAVAMPAVSTRGSAWRLPFACAAVLVAVTLVKVSGHWRLWLARGLEQAPSPVGPRLQRVGANGLPPRALLLVSALASLAEAPAVYFAVFHAVRDAGMDPAGARSMVLLGGAGALSVMILCGLLIDRAGALWVAAGALVLRWLAIAAFFGSAGARPSQLTTAYFLLTSSVLVGLVSLRNLTLDSVDESARARLAGQLGLVVSLGSLASMWFVSFVAERVGIAGAVSQLSWSLLPAVLLLLALSLRRASRPGFARAEPVSRATATPID